MKQVFALIVFALALGFVGCEPTTSATEETAAGEVEGEAQTAAAYAMVIHGGAGTIKKENMTPEREKAYREALNQALTIGEQILKEGGSSRDAVIETIKFMEDSPLFNAGKGAVFTHDEQNELDASIMDGATFNAGAVGGVTILKNPITAARAVMENSKHLMLSGEGAEQFALEQELETVDPEYFYTERRWKALQRAKAQEEKDIGSANPQPDQKFGTVGCVALDRNGNITAGTSTGGMTNKKYNRIGDSPIIGAGTYANNATCGVSCTGHGEYFIRYAVAHDMSALMAYQGLDVSEAGEEIIQRKLKEAGGSGGLIALDAQGNIAMPFNTAGMYRGYVKPDDRKVMIYGAE